MARDPLALDAAIEVLRRFSLLRRNPDTHTLTIHRLVQAVIVDQMVEPTRRRYAALLRQTEREAEAARLEAGASSS